MKITFNQSLGELNPRINAPTKAEKSDSEAFATLLRDISPFRPEPIKLIEENKSINISPPSQNFEDSGPMASLKMPPPAMVAGQPGRLSINEYNDNLLTDSVKTPTLLEAKRIRSANPYQNMTQSQRGYEVMKLSNSLGGKYGVDPTLALAVAEAESSFNPKAVSQDGHESKGLFQLLDGTGKEMLNRIGSEEEYDPFDPAQNSELGISYLRRLHDLFSTQSEIAKDKVTIPAANSTSLEKLAVAAYNAGEGRVASAQKAALLEGRNPAEYYQVEPYLPETTQQYVRKVDEIRARYAGPESDLEGS